LKWTDRSANDRKHFLNPHLQFIEVRERDHHGFA
jgi:hypothetical protein